MEKTNRKRNWSWQRRWLRGIIHKWTWPINKGSTLLPATDLPFDELEGILLVHNTNVAGLLLVTDTVALVCDVDHLRPESGADELPTLRRLVQHLRHGSSILCVEIGVDLVEEIEGRGIRSLNGKDQSKRAKTRKSLA